VGAGISNAWIGFDPLLLSIGSGEPRARVGILAVARDDAEETIIGKAAGILAEVRNTTFAFVAAGSEWNQGTVNTARAGGVKRIKMLTRLRDGQETVQGAEAVLALCPEAVYLARRHGKSVIVPPVWEAWRAAYDLCPESICEDWEVAKNLIREGAWPACPSPKNAIKLGQHTAEKMLLILGGADHER